MPGGGYSPPSPPKSVTMTFSCYKGMHKLNHFFIIYLTKKRVNLHVLLFVSHMCVSSPFATINKYQGQVQGSKLQGQGPPVKT